MNNPIPAHQFPSLDKKVDNRFWSREHFVILNDMFVCDSMYYHWKEIGNKPLPDSSPNIIVRESVKSMLSAAEKALPAGYRFKIYDGWRSIKVQQALWDHYRNINRQAHPDLSDSEIDELTRHFVSLPSLDESLPSLHNTGGAIDLTIIDPYGNELDMGCEFDDFSEKAYSDYFEKIDSDYAVSIRNNRRLLYNAMINAGFTNLPSEWWHYDYGDAAWAYFTDNSPIYPGVV